MKHLTVKSFLSRATTIAILIVSVIIFAPRNVQAAVVFSQLDHSNNTASSTYAGWGNWIWPYQYVGTSTVSTNIRTIKIRPITASILSNCSNGLAYGFQLSPAGGTSRIGSDYFFASSTAAVDGVCTYVTAANDVNVTAGQAYSIMWYSAVDSNGFASYNASALVNQNYNDYGYPGNTFHDKGVPDMYYLICDDYTCAEPPISSPSTDSFPTNPILTSWTPSVMNEATTSPVWFSATGSTTTAGPDRGVYFTFKNLDTSYNYAITLPISSSGIFNVGTTTVRYSLDQSYSNSTTTLPDGTYSGTLYLLDGNGLIAPSQNISFIIGTSAYSNVYPGSTGILVPGTTFTSGTGTTTCDSGGSSTACLNSNNILSFLNVPNLLRTKVPFAWFFLARDIITAQTSTSTGTTTEVNRLISLPFATKFSSTGDGHAIATSTLSIDLFSTTTRANVTSKIGVDIFTLIRSTLALLLYYEFVMYLYHDAKSKKHLF